MIPDIFKLCNDSYKKASGCDNWKHLLKLTLAAGSRAGHQVWTAEQWPEAQGLQMPRSQCWEGTGVAAAGGWGLPTRAKKPRSTIARLSWSLGNSYLALSFSLLLPWSGHVQIKLPFLVDLLGCCVQSSDTHCKAEQMGSVLHLGVLVPLRPSWSSCGPVTGQGPHPQGAQSQSQVWSWLQGCSCLSLSHLRR